MEMKCCKSHGKQPTLRCFSTSFPSIGILGFFPVMCISFFVIAHRSTVLSILSSDLIIDNILQLTHACPKQALHAPSNTITVIILVGDIPAEGFLIQVIL